MKTHARLCLLEGCTRNLGESIRLRINRYKEIEHGEIAYAPPKVALRTRRNLDSETQVGLVELDGMLV